MVELHSVIKQDGKYIVKFKRTAKDINDNDVVMLSGVHTYTEEQVIEQITQFEEQKVNMDYQITKLQNILIEIDKLK